MKKHIDFTLSSASLHLIAMALMLCDHLWATVLPGQTWLTWIGRIAFPIFAFLTAEGLRHTSDFSRYLKRLLVFALLSEIPFNLVCGGSVVYPFHQNVLWTFLLSLAAIRLMGKTKKWNRPWLAVPVCLAIIFVTYGIATLSMVDYQGAGFLTVLAFCLFPGKTPWEKLGQLAALCYINIYVLQGYYVPVTVFGLEIPVYQQSLAVLALIPIWLYNGQKGFGGKAFRYLCYGFYPGHLLVLYLIWQLLSR